MDTEIKKVTKSSLKPSIKTKPFVSIWTKIYGTFAEIGAGQETVRHFFRSGGSSGTIAKAMSAYDKDFSDAIWYRADGRYVTESVSKEWLPWKANWRAIEQRKTSS
jgi:hypothetical protein